MNRKNPIRRYRRFTGDTGGTLDWQIGFDDPMFHDFLGLGNKAENRRREETYNEVRNKYYPVITACSNGSEQLPILENGAWVNKPCGSACQYITAKLPQLYADIAEAKRKIDTGESKDVAPRWLEAFNLVMEEYTSYYNKNCLGGPGTTTAPAGPVVNTTPAVNQDPIVQSAQPSGATTTGTGSSTSSPGTGGSAGTGQPTSGSGSPAAVNAGNMVEGLKKVPKWAWWAAGGAVAITAIILIVKNRS